MSKEDRFSSDEVYVVGFVPSSELPKSRPCSIDSFLNPLVTDLTDIFINGKYDTMCMCISAFMVQREKICLTNISVFD